MLYFWTEKIKQPRYSLTTTTRTSATTNVSVNHTIDLAKNYFPYRLQAF